MRVEIHPDARAELRSAAEFLDAVASVVDRISRTPESSPSWIGLDDRVPAIRRHTMHRFPYVVAFEQRQEHVLVLAIAHAKRRPLYWLTRAEP